MVAGTQNCMFTISFILLLEPNGGDEFVLQIFCAIVKVIVCRFCSVKSELNHSVVGIVCSRFL